MTRMTRNEIVAELWRLADGGEPLDARYGICHNAARLSNSVEIYICDVFFQWGSNSYPFGHFDPSEGRNLWAGPAGDLRRLTCATIAIYFEEGLDS